jgi:cell wall-associated NlpC family hydrolase
MDWVFPLLGKPWQVGAEGPDAFDCWGLCRHVYRTILGVELPPSPHVIKSTDPGPVTRAITKTLANGSFVEIEKPTPFCLVAMSAHRAFHHVGLYLPVDGGRVLHARDGCNVVLQSAHGLRFSGISRKAFYEFTECFKRS